MADCSLLDDGQPIMAEVRASTRSYIGRNLRVEKIDTAVKTIASPAFLEFNNYDLELPLPDISVDHTLRMVAVLRPLHARDILRFRVGERTLPVVAYDSSHSYLEVAGTHFILPAPFHETLLIHVAIEAKPLSVTVSLNGHTFEKAEVPGEWSELWGSRTARLVVGCREEGASFQLADLRVYETRRDVELVRFKPARSEAHTSFEEMEHAVHERGHLVALSEEIMKTAEGRVVTLSGEIMQTAEQCARQAEQLFILSNTVSTLTELDLENTLMDALKRLRSDVRAVDERLAHVEHTVDAHEKRVEEATTNVNTMAGKLRSVEDAQAAVDRALSSQREDWEKFQQSFAEGDVATKTSISSAQRTIAATDERLKANHRALDQLRDTSDALEAEVARIGVQVEQLAVDHEVLNERLPAVEKDAKDAKAMFATLREELTGQTEALLREVEAHARRIGELEGRCEGQFGILAETVGTVKTHNGVLQSLEVAMKRSEEAELGLKADVMRVQAALRANADKCLASLANLASGVDKENAKFNEATDRWNRLSASVTALEQRVEKALVRIEKINDDEVGLRAVRDDLNGIKVRAREDSDIVRKAETDVKVLAEQVQGLRQQFRDFEGQLGRLKQDLQVQSELHSKELQGSTGTKNLEVLEGVRRDISNMWDRIRKLNTAG